MAQHQQRIAKAQSLMQKEGYSVLFAASAANLRYFTGLQIIPDERMELVLIPAEGRPALFLSGLYKSEAQSLVEDYELYFHGDGQDLKQILGSLIPSDGKLAVDERMWAGHLLQIWELAGKDRPYENSSDLMDSLRIYKSEEEISYLQKAGQIAAAAWEKTLPQIIEGLSELQLANILENNMRELGGEGLSFATIIAFGKHSAAPHHVPGPAFLRKGDPIVMDFGCTYHGYCADITRTVTFGPAADDFIKIYDIVAEALKKAKDSIKPGATTGQVDAAARGVIDTAGFGEYFIHRISHGVGLDVHEGPRFPVREEGEELRPGMVFSVEPGIYLPDRFGVRIEDVVAIGNDGYPIDMHILDKKLRQLPAD